MNALRTAVALVALGVLAVPALASAGGIDAQTVTYCIGPDSTVMQLTRTGEQYCKEAGERLEPSGESPSDIATAAVAECASDHSLLAIMDSYCRLALGAAWQAPDWRTGVRNAAMDGAISARAARANGPKGATP